MQNYWLAIKTLISLHKDEQQYNTFYLRQQPESDWNVPKNLVFVLFVGPIVFLSRLLVFKIDKRASKQDFL